MKFKKSELLKICLYLIMIASVAVVLIMFTGKFAEGKFGLTYFNGYDLVFNFDTKKNTTLFIAWLLLLLGGVQGLFELVVIFLRKVKVLPKKNSDNKGLIALSGLLELAIAVMAAIFIFLTVKTFELDNLYVLGSGAVVAGIFAIVSGVAVAGVRAVEYVEK